MDRTSEDQPLLPSGLTDESVSERVSAIVLKRPVTRGWLGGFAIAFLLLMMFNYAIAVLFTYGVGIWGLQIPVAWGFAIVNFVWWVGIGHAGTFISAVLFLCHQQWRNSINRFTESMTLFAIACAGSFPLLHLGRPWLFYYLFPYPNTMALWPQFRSPLMWDMFAVMTYAIVSVVFYFVGQLPDFATLRDRAPHHWQRVIYGILALGWRGSGRQWARYQAAYLIMAGLATPLVVSVHSIVSLDFAVGIVPGWHSSIMPYYFVAGALLSGFSMGLTLVIPVRHFYHLEDLITGRHLANMAKLMIATSLVVAHGYITDTFMAWYSGDSYDKFITIDKFTGAYAIPGCLFMLMDVGVVQLLWIRAVRERPLALFVIALVANVGLWMDHFILVVQSLHEDYLPSAWKVYLPTQWDWMTLFGSLGLFLTLLFLFIRIFPMMAMSEVRKLGHELGSGKAGA
ncbi:MAG TPA: NrfD/PsrC family molybdoenzyme membrane anchor subunit [Candidatus Methylacidiphilales bacterium]|nr:NrfD/PsrC family molybdoenzyme membrane anchor subunit [Candidatus Methylacidiphilales bacterium]